MKPVLAYGLVAGLVVVIDQAIKLWVEAALPFQQPISILPFLALYRTYNTGMAFSMLSGFGDVALMILAVGVIAFVLWLALRSEDGQKLARLGFSLVIGGAVGNLIDRALYGHVVDYVLFHTPVWSFAVFNLADAAISVGAGLIVLEEFLAWRRQKSPGH